MGVTTILLHPPLPQDDTLGLCIPQTLQVQDEQDWPRDITHLRTPQRQRRRRMSKIDTNITNLGLEPNDTYVFHKLHYVPLHFNYK